MNFLKKINFTLNNSYSVNDNYSKSIQNSSFNQINNSHKDNFSFLNSKKKNIIPSKFRHSMFIGIKGSGSGCGSCG